MLVARMLGFEPPLQFTPAAVNIPKVVPSRSHLVQGLVYPLPLPSGHGLGVHFTRTLSGQITRRSERAIRFRQRKLRGGARRGGRVLRGIASHAHPRSNLTTCVRAIRDFERASLPEHDHSFADFVITPDPCEAVRGSRDRDRVTRTNLLPVNRRERRRNGPRILGVAEGEHGVTG
jgi:hypothetical protein